MAIDQVSGGLIKDDAITATKIATGAVEIADVADDAITSAKIAAGAVDTTALGADAVTAAKIADDAIGAAAIADDAIGAAAIADDAVGAAAIADGAIDAAAKIADDAITGAKLTNDVAISTTGNIATTGTGTLTVAGASNFASIATGTLGSSVTFPSGHILGVQNAVMRGAQAIGTTLIDVTDGTTALSVTSTNTNATKFYIVAMIYMGTDNDVGTHMELWTEKDGGGFSKLNDAHSTYGGGGASHKDFMFAAAGDNDTWNRYTGTHCTNSFLWTPGSFSTSVKAKIRADGYSGTTYVGRDYTHDNSSDWAHAVPSFITMWEIK